MMDTLVRRLERADMKQIIGLLKENMSSYAPDESEHDAIWEEYTSQGNMYGVVATIDGAVAGYASMLIETRLRGGRVGHMEDIVSSGAFRRRGVGTKLMNALLEIAKEKECYRVCVTIPEHNIPFYESIGYAVDGLSISQFVIRK